MDNRRGGVDILAIMGAAALGAIIGAGFALMMAPKPGAELREDIKHTAQSAHERIHAVTDKVVNQIKSASEELTSKAKHAAEAVEDAKETAAEELEEA